MLYLAGIVLAFFFSLLLLTKKEKSAADYVLAIWLSLLGYHQLSFYLLHTGEAGSYPLLIGLGFPLPLVHGPFLYLYVCLQTSPRPFRAVQLLHFVPVMLSYGLFTEFLLLPHDEMVEVFRTKGRGYELEMIINRYAIYLSGILYVTLSLIRLLRYRRNLVHQFSNTEKINFNWLLYLIVWMIIIWIVIILLREDWLIFGAAALFVIWIGYFSIKQVQVFGPGSRSATHTVQGSAELHTQTNNTPLKNVTFAEDEMMEVADLGNLKYATSALTEEEANRIHTQLQLVLQNQKPYLDPELKLNELARNLDVHPNTLSQVINTRENRNFYDLINALRIDEFIHRVSEPESQQFTLLGIAFDCGFNSKATFNRNFKKYTGLTPSGYLKLQQH